MSKAAVFSPKVIIQHTVFCMLTYLFRFHTSFTTKLGKSPEGEGRA